MKINEELLEELKKHTQAIKVAMPDLSKEERMKIVRKAIMDSADIDASIKEEIIQILSNID